MKLWTAFVTGLCLATGACAQVPVLAAGAALPALALKDQHDRPAPVAADTRQILFAADNAGAKLMTAWLDAKPAGWLNDTQRVYLADIHQMPGLVTRLFALPKLQEKPYRIVLGREAADLAMFPRRKECVTLLPVTAGQLGEAAYACDAASLAAQLQ